MNIFYSSCSSANNYNMPESKIWDINLKSSLQKFGELTVPSFEVGKQYSEIYKVFATNNTLELANLRSKYSEMLLRDVKSHHDKHGIDLLFTYYSSRHILPEVVDEIKKLGIVTINFFCNNIHQFHLVSEIAPHFDYCIFPEKGALTKYLAIGARPVHLQMAANPDFYKPYPVEKTYDVTFVGQKYLNREEILTFLFENYVDVHVRGAGWTNTALPSSHAAGPVNDDELIKMFSRSRISLNISEVVIQDNSQDAGHITRHIRLRDFEAPMSGAFYMTGYQKELEEYFEIDKEIICYDSKEELLDKVKYFLKHPQEAEIIRQSGHARALRDHKWENRFMILFKGIGLKV